MLFYLPKLAQVASTWGEGEALPAQKEKLPPWTGSPIWPARQIARQL